MMVSRTARLLLLFLAVLFLAGCATKIPHVIVSDYTKRGARLIAVMPVGGTWANPSMTGQTNHLPKRRG